MRYCPSKHKDGGEVSNGFVQSVKEKSTMIFVLIGKERQEGGGDNCIVGIQRQIDMLCCYEIVSVAVLEGGIVNNAR